MTDITTRLLEAKKILMERKKILDENKFVEQDTIAKLVDDIREASRFVGELERQREKELKEKRARYLEKRALTPDYLTKKRERENAGRARKNYYLKTSRGGKKFKSVKMFLEYYRDNPDADYFVIIRYSGNKIVDGVYSRKLPLTKNDILALS